MPAFLVVLTPAIAFLALGLVVLARRRRARSRQEFLARVEVIFRRRLEGIDGIAAVRVMEGRVSVHVMDDTAELRAEVDDALAEVGIPYEISTHLPGIQPTEPWPRPAPAEKE